MSQPKYVIIISFAAPDTLKRRLKKNAVPSQNLPVSSVDQRKPSVGITGASETIAKKTQLY
jgi:hypothetical protein